MYLRSIMMMLLPFQCLMVFAQTPPRKPIPTKKSKQVATTAILPPPVVRDFEEARAFRESLAAVKIDGKWGFVNRGGQLVIPAQFESVGNFSEGLVAAVQDGLLGFLNNSGTFTIQPQFKAPKDTWLSHTYKGVWSFSDELARIDLPDGKEFYIHKSGNQMIVLPSEVRYCSGFSNELAEAWTSEGHGYIDKTGKFVIPPKYTEGEDFSEGLAAVRVRDYPETKIGFINLQGEFVIAPKFFPEASVSFYNMGGEWEFHEGLAAVFDRSKLAWGYVNKSGSWSILAEFHAAGSFSEGFAVVSKNCQRSMRVDLLGVRQIERSKCKDFYLINRTGAAVFWEPLRSQTVGVFSEGLVIFRVNDNFGYVDSAGRTIIEPIFQEARSFSEGLAMVKTNGRWNFIDQKGKPAW